ncbi:MAG: type II/IV secretion system protein [Bacteroidota bacterium]|nr:type II/IV secretion system protein [Bacteroidota bacterium]
MFKKEDLIFRDYCFGKGLMTEAQWKQFEDIVNNYGMNGGLAQSLVEFKFFSEQDIATALAEAFNLPFMKLYAETASAPKEIIPDSFLRTHRTIPMLLFGNELTVAIIDPPYHDVVEELVKLTGYRIIPVVSTVSDFQETLKIQSGGFDEIQKIASTIDLEKFDLVKGGERNIQQMETLGQFPPIVHLVDEMILRAIKGGSSDIHIEPFEDEVKIRFRSDGVLHRIASFPKRFAEGIAAVVKTKSSMDIFEKHKPQDGRIAITYETRSFDLRISVLPTMHGEKIVMRILSKSPVAIKLEELGFSVANLALFNHLLEQPNGLLLVTGPTGSGKSTTLYAALNKIKSVERNIVTVENPVEYQVETVNQVQVDVDRELTFAAVMRAILRQDPNVMFVGEIRDVETGTIATEAALTGHLVLSTLHTNDSVGAIPRLINMGIPAYWLAPALTGVAAQRLVRKICEHCKEEYQPREEVLYATGLSAMQGKVTFYRGVGCEQCNFKGYKGRLAIHEVLAVNEHIQDLIYQNATIVKILEEAQKGGFHDLRFDGLKKVIAGLTTLEEVRRVTRSGL